MEKFKSKVYELLKAVPPIDFSKYDVKNVYLEFFYNTSIRVSFLFYGSDIFYFPEDVYKSPLPRRDKEYHGVSEETRKYYEGLVAQSRLNPLVHAYNMDTLVLPPSTEKVVVKLKGPSALVLRDRPWFSIKTLVKQYQAYLSAGDKGYKIVAHVQRQLSLANHKLKEEKKREEERRRTEAQQELIISSSSCSPITSSDDEVDTKLVRRFNDLGKR